MRIISAAARKFPVVSLSNQLRQQFVLYISYWSKDHATAMISVKPAAAGCSHPQQLQPFVAGVDTKATTRSNCTNTRKTTNFTYMVLKCLFYGLAMMGGFSASAQVIPTSQILRSVQSDNVVQYQQQHVNLMTDTRANLPFAEELSLRTETDRFDPARQEYLARLSVNGLNEMRYTKALHNVEIQSAAQEQNIYLHDALAARYTGIANYYIAMQAYAINRELAAVYDDRFLVLRKIAAAQPGEAADDLIRTEYDRDEVQLDILDDSASMRAWRQQLEMWLPDPEANWTLDTSDFISIDKMVSVMAGIPSSGLQNPHIGDKQTDIALIKQEYSLAKANSHQMLDFVQLRYSNSPTQPFRNDIGIGLGISLPFRGSARPKLAELAFEQNEADMQLQVLADQLAAEVSMAKNKIVALVAQYHHALQQWNDSQAKYTLGQSANTQLDGPITMLRARELQLHRQLNLLDLQQEILEHYLLVLDLSGYMSVEPYVNYLSEELVNW